LAKLARERESDGNEATLDADEATGMSGEHLTSPGVAVGTVSYMSPEQLRARELDGRTDLFSLGVVLYEMATGSLPFRGESSAVIMEAILNRAPLPPARLNPEVPAKLEEVISKALEKDKNLRYQRASEIRRDLQRIKRDSDAGHPAFESGKADLAGFRDQIPSISPVAALHRPAKRAAIVGAALAIIVLALGGWPYFARRAHALTDKDTVVLADFDNKTGDAVFDDTLR
jgi:eukaryotic-like serine/threonine-protein kinase